MKRSMINPNSIATITFAMILAGVALWGTNTVASVVVFTIALAIITITIWDVFVSRIELETGFATTRYNKQALSPNSLIDIERKMQSKLEQIERGYDQFLEDVDDPDLIENTIEDYDAEIPIELLDGISGEICERIESIGILDIDELAIADPDEIAEAARVPKQIAEQWVLDAKALFVGAQLSSLIPLSMAEAKDVLRSIEESVISGMLKMPVDYELPITKVEKWINRANKLVSSFDVSEIQKLLEEEEH